MGRQTEVALSTPQWLLSIIPRFFHCVLRCSAEPFPLGSHCQSRNDMSKEQLEYKISLQKAYDSWPGPQPMVLFWEVLETLVGGT